MNYQPIHILMAEDDPEDQLLVQTAFDEARVVNDLDIVNNGEELLAFLRREGKYAGKKLPDLILLDLNMPRMDGREALATIKQDPTLHRIPVVVLTTSAAEKDILESYDLGANSYVQKPVTFEKLVEVVEAINKYWLGIVKFPTGIDS